MARRRLLFVRNTIGQRSRFSVQRYTEDAVRGGDRRPRALRRGRRLEADLNRAGAVEVTTDDIRHWTREQDPLVFAARRRVRDVRSGEMHWVDPRLGRIARLAAAVAPVAGPLLTELLLDYFVPGAGTVALLRDDEEKQPVTKRDDVELRYGDLVDEIMPQDADYSRFGSTGGSTVPDTSGRQQTFLIFISPDDTAGTLVRPKPPGPIRCDTPFVVYVSYYRNAPGCVRVDFRSVVRGALLYAVEEGVRRCLTSPCTDARARFLSASWGCGFDQAVASVLIEVTCLAT